MMRLILNGAGGRMGAVVRDLLAERNNRRKRLS